MGRAKGRHWVALWLVAFLVTTWLVYARQTAAIRAARELADLRARRANLDGHRADLERPIRAAQSRAVLLPRAQARLSLHPPGGLRSPHQPAARPDGAHLAAGAAPAVRLLRRAVQRARGAAPAERARRASGAGAEPVLSRSLRRARDHRPPGG